MKQFDIDSLIPEYKSPIKLPKRPTKRDIVNNKRMSRVHTAGPSYRNGTFGASPPGVEPAKVLDWRSLERRAHELHVKWVEANDKFWDAVLAARADAGLGLNEDIYIFVEHEWVLKCHPSGFSTENAVEIAEEHVNGKRRGNKFAIMKYDEGGAHIGYLNRRSNLLLRCMGVYERILERALRDRLQLYVDKIRENDMGYRAYFPPQVYIIENEGRARIAQSDALGRLSWINGNVMITR